MKKKMIERNAMIRPDEPAISISRLYLCCLLFVRTWLLCYWNPNGITASDVNTLDALRKSSLFVRLLTRIQIAVPTCRVITFRLWSTLGDQFTVDDHLPTAIGWRQSIDCVAGWTGTKHCVQFENCTLIDLFAEDWIRQHEFSRTMFGWTIDESKLWRSNSLVIDHVHLSFRCAFDVHVRIQKSLDTFCH